MAYPYAVGQHKPIKQGVREAASSGSVLYAVGSGRRDQPPMNNPWTGKVDAPCEQDRTGVRKRDYSGPGFSCRHRDLP
jgi:hypothetical protein